ncbi:MAG: luxQ 3, partial [Gemmatimonadetes bacterium]|nr:luxQ 3 [Gemmatimonadota bacterium]
MNSTPLVADSSATVFAGHGEMYERCRAMDWSATPLGPVSGWSQSLRTIASTVLASRNPMFLWWGPDLVQLYNDAYRPSLGEGGRHPRALGMRGREFWTDIWPVIGPQVEQVMTTGEATWHEDQYLPIERNGRLDDVWWTYGYSPVRDDDGSIGGTLVVCQETTHRILGERERDRLRYETARAEERAAQVLEQMADAYLAMDKHFVIAAANAAAERVLGVARDTLVGRTLWEAFPASVGSEVERQYRRVQAERVDAHFEHHYVDAVYDVYLDIDLYPTDDGGVAVFWRDITAKVRAQQEERESDARLRAIFDGTNEYVGLLAPDGTMLEANRSSLEFAGNSRQDVVGRPFWDTPWFTPTPGAPEFVRRSVERAASGETVRFEAELRRPSGELAAFDISLHPIRDAHGDVVLIVPEGRDVTERHRAEAALRESETRYRTLFESLDEGFCVIEVLFDATGAANDYRFVETNIAFVSQTGLVNANGKRISELVPDTEPHWFERYGRVALTGEATRFDAPARAMHRWFDAYAFRIGRPEEHKVAVLFKDVSEARAAAAEKERLLRALEVERERLAYVFKQAPAFLAVLRGPQFVFELANDAYYQLVGHRELIGKPVFDALPDVRGQGFEELLRHIVRTGEPFVGREQQLVVVRSPGAAPEARFLDFVYLPLVEADGTRAGVIAHGTDVTEQVHARREIERLYTLEQHARATVEEAYRIAESANRAKAEFLAVMSHELRTPLNAIGGYAELLALGVRGELNPEQRHDLQRIQGSQQHLLSLINDILNFAKLEAGKVEIVAAAFDVRKTIDALEPLLAPQLRA